MKINTLKIDKVNKAFTVAELVIVIAVIGFLAVIILSSLSNVVPNKEKALFKKAYEVTERTVSELVNDESFYAYDPERIGFLNEDVVKIPNTGADTVAASKFCELFAYKLNTFDVEVALEAGETVCKFNTTDGIRWEVPGQFTASTPALPVTSIEIKIDVNDESLPNKDTDDDRDRFKIVVASDGGVSVPLKEFTIDETGANVEVDSLESRYLKSHEMK